MSCWLMKAFFDIDYESVVLWVIGLLKSSLMLAYGRLIDALLDVEFYSIIFWILSKTSLFLT